ncbi:MAG: endonuclease III [Candidatus Cloacimonetes bacterium 4572_55]|nr:MAG: endonuclease III [Candidatus Cloacimonetes bacterium 4572_55]
MTKSHVLTIIKRLRGEFPDATCGLLHENPWQLLIATILSAQCTDKRVNEVTKKLFAERKSIADFANADLGKLEQEVHSTGFYRNKAANIKKCCILLLKNFDGQVPNTMKKLTSLPGVGRKTANVILGNAFGLNVGIVVDTHVKRISNLLGLTKEKNPVKIERNLMEVIPRTEWILFSHYLILHGRKTCIARRPNCPECLLADLCLYACSINIGRSQL